MCASISSISFESGGGSEVFTVGKRDRTGHKVTKIKKNGANYDVFREGATTLVLTAGSVRVLK